MVTVDIDVTAHSQSKLGLRYRAGDVYEVGREKVREYARAVQDDAPAHWDEQAAAALGLGGLATPATFMSIPAMMANRLLFEKILVGYQAFVQTDQVFEFHAPVVAGQRVLADVELSGVRHIAGKDLLTVTNRFTDEDGRVVQTMHTTVAGLTAADVDPGVAAAVKGLMMYGIRMDGHDDPAAVEAELRVAPEPGPLAESGTPRTAVSVGAVSAGDELPGRTVRLTRGDLVNYAGVSGDANPIHWDDRCAALIGLPGVIAHGMVTMAYGAGFVSAWTGNPAALTKLTARLSSTVPVTAEDGAEIEYTGKVKSVDPETGSVVVVITARSAGKKIFGLATATVRLSG